MKIVHIFYGTYPDVNPERDARNALAQESWHHEYGRCPGTWVAKEVKPDDLGWLSALSPGNPMPFVHDLIDAGMKLCGVDDVLFMTNADVGFAPGIAERIIAASEFGSAHMKRKEIGANAPQPTPEEIIAAPEYCGMDGTAMIPKWWKANRSLLPSDMIWGAYGWDSALRNLVRWKGGVEIKDALYHREHNSLWNSSVEKIYKDPANHHNRLLLWKWILDHGGSEADHLFSDGELEYR